MAAHLIHHPGLTNYTKDTKQTKSKSLARKAIDFLPTAGGALLKVANMADSAGYIQNPYLKGGLKVANTARSIYKAHPKLVHAGIGAAGSIVKRVFRRK